MFESWTQSNPGQIEGPTIHSIHMGNRSHCKLLPVQVYKAQISFRCHSQVITCPLACVSPCEDSALVEKKLHKAA